MAISTTNIETQSGRGGAVGVFTRMYNGLVHIAEMNYRAREAERFTAMSDAELARHGLKREDIARHVFRDIISL